MSAMLETDESLIEAGPTLRIDASTISRAEVAVRQALGGRIRLICRAVAEGRCSAAMKRRGTRSAATCSRGLGSRLTGRGSEMALRPVRVAQLP